MNSTSVSQRDLRMRSKEIMDAVERGESFTITRDGREIGALVPVRTTERFVSREAFAAGSLALPHLDPEQFRADLDAAIDPYPDDPFARAGR